MRLRPVVLSVRAVGAAGVEIAEGGVGQIPALSRRFQEALDLMQRSLPADDEPDFGIPKDRMCAAVAMAWQKLDRPAEAREAWQRVLKLVPDDAKALAALRDLNRRFPQKRAKKR